MILSGKILQWGEPLPLAKLVVVNSLGHVKSPTNGVTADLDGRYTINVNPDDYLRVSDGGIQKRIKVSEVCKQNSCKFDIRLEGRHQEQEAIEVIAVRKPKAEYKKPSWSKYLLVAGLSLIGVAAIAYGIKKMKK
jgi:hypothetical protein